MSEFGFGLFVIAKEGFSFPLGMSLTEEQSIWLSILNLAVAFLQTLCVVLPTDLQLKYHLVVYDELDTMAKESSCASSPLSVYKSDNLE